MRLDELGWQARGACTTPEVRAAIKAGKVTFFPERGENVRPAKKICAGCPVRAECLEYAMSCGIPTHGVWGGYSEKDRRRMRRAQHQAAS